MFPHVGITITSAFRNTCQNDVKEFAEHHLSWLLANSQLHITANTFDSLLNLLPTNESKSEFRSKVNVLPARARGVVELTVGVIEKKIAAVIHLCTTDDLASSRPLRVLSRQALVHNIVYMDDLLTADALINVWKNNNKMPLVPTVAEPVVPFSIFKDKKVISLIAHNGKKTEMCLLVIEFMDVISKFDYIICTGTTGGLVKSFLKAGMAHQYQSGRNLSSAEISRKIIQYQSGPLGGDVQIAEVVLRGFCSDIIFLIDPLTPQPHEPDIKFMEELLQSTRARVITNTQSAKYLLQSYRSANSKL